MCVSENRGAKGYNANQKSKPYLFIIINETHTHNNTHINGGSIGNLDTKAKLILLSRHSQPKYILPQGLTLMHYHNITSEGWITSDIPSSGGILPVLMLKFKVGIAKESGLCGIIGYKLCSST